MSKLAVELQSVPSGLRVNLQKRNQNLQHILIEHRCLPCFISKRRYSPIHSQRPVSPANKLILKNQPSTGHIISAEGFITCVTVSVPRVCNWMLSYDMLF